IGLGLYDYGARRYDPALGRFIQADTIVPQPGNPQALNRYTYVLGNPLRYRDPTGHFWWIAAGAAVGAAVAYGAQVAGNLDQGMDLGAALTTNINGTTIVAGALAGAAVVALAPAAVAMAGEALMGAGLLTGSTGLFSAGIGAGGMAATMSAAVYGGSAATATTRSVAPESGYKTSDVAWSRMGKTQAGGTLWGSDDQIVGSHAYQLADELTGTGSKHVTLLSGTHGNKVGATAVENSGYKATNFYNDDVAHYSGAAHVRVLDMTTTSTAQLRTLTGQVVCAWCWSDRSTLIQELTRR
ncbi:MAG: hypothetical protein CVU38_21000, partial [Chloroflexi bacterium HGW-Chloroflexi-1]